ncbi:T-complex protein 1 subunit theta-like [Malaclemys terrapin pileata]|uniref:T-complex protein 1 subunit theta-like n=1 Tax=Malaclemys terrapin pileata TaxID=2991368 RepID=UPI0023A7DDF3|nr:T-complex protein 1 subunit theta-like [Malaclemys terrapin pileata]
MTSPVYVRFAAVGYRPPGAGDRTPASKSLPPTCTTMAAHVPLPPGLPQLLKAGTKYFSGLQESLFSHITACRALAMCLRTSYGPLGHNKLVITHLGKALCTAHAGTILRELELENPVARMLGAASQAQEEETGDGANAVVLLAGALLDNAEKLLRAGLPVAAVRDGYDAACKEAVRLLPGLACHVLADLRDPAGVAGALRAAVGSKLFGYQDFLAGLVARCCVAALSPEGAFEPNNVRLCKVPGGGVTDSCLLEGMVFCTEVESQVHQAHEARIAVYCCPFGLARSETKGMVLFQGAAEMRAYGDAEEALLGQRVRAIAEEGASVVVVGGRVDPLALQYADQLGLMVVRLSSRLELQCLCRAVGAVPLASLVPPPPGAIGHCRRVYLSEIGSTAVVVFRQDGGACPVATILLRGATHELLCSLEEAVTDGLNTYKALVSDRRLLPGAGATEMALAVRLATLGTYLPSLEQYGILEFAQALKTLPAALAENAGLPVNETMAALEALHQLGTATAGVRPGEGGAPTMDAAREGVLDSLLVKEKVLRLAVHTATTLLGVSHILVAKKSGGPKVRGENPNWDLEPDALE